MKEGKSGDSEDFRSGKQVRCPHADVSGEGGSGHRQRACEVEFPGHFGPGNFG